MLLPLRYQARSGGWCCVEWLLSGDQVEILRCCRCATELGVAVGVVLSGCFQVIKWRFFAALRMTGFGQNDRFRAE